MRRNVKCAFSISLVVSGLIFLIGTGTASPFYAANVDPAYRVSFEKWKAEEIDDLKQNWLPLAGLFWLKPGANSFGSDPGNDIVLPQGSAPARAGIFEFNANDVTVKFLPGVSAKIGGKPSTTSALQPDASGTPTVIELGSLRMHVIKRGQRTGIRVKDLNSLAARNYHGPIFFDLNLAYRVTATWVPANGKKTIDIPNVLGDTTSTPVAGEVRFKLNGQDLQLTDLGGDPSKGLFIVFNDLTSKTETYPGGRFLETDPPANGTVVLDFNRAHNPPCAVTPYATCPLAPKENRLAIALPAGEKYDRFHAHH
ncbi:MAG TPA: DUF1684 domain-containing protein [Terriglobales bacterium]|nr:DUF1684 domain-containing protein [Terriglobales bacterium]